MMESILLVPLAGSQDAERVTEGVEPADLAWSPRDPGEPESER